MAAVIRVKRRLDEEPLDTLVVNCKRRKTEAICLDDDLSTVFKLSGTANSQEDDVFKHIKKPTKDEIEEQFKKHAININDKLRQQKANASKENRFKVVNLRRSNYSNVSSDAENLDVTIVDIEADENKENIQLDKPQYVYDLYYTNTDGFDEVDMNDLISIYPLSDDLVNDSQACALNLDSDDSEDSNAENNWRNDYPDESDVESITEDDMLAAVKRITIDEDLSSTDGEEGFVYSIDSEAAGFEEDIDPTDVRRYGEMYARFKARAKKADEKSVEHDLYCGDTDEEQYYS